MEKESDTLENLRHKLEREYISVLNTRIGVNNFSNFYEEAIL